MTPRQNALNCLFRQGITVLVSLFGLLTFTFAQQPESNIPRGLTLRESVALALKHNHAVRIAAFHVDEEQHAKEVARSAYLPTIRNDSVFAHATDTLQIDGRHEDYTWSGSLQPAQSREFCGPK